MSNGIERFIDRDKKVPSCLYQHADKELAFSDWPLLRREIFERGYFDRNLDGTAYKRL